MNCSSVLILYNCPTSENEKIKPCKSWKIWFSIDILWVARPDDPQLNLTLSWTLPLLIHLSMRMEQMDYPENTWRWAYFVRRIVYKFAYNNAENSIKLMHEGKCKIFHLDMYNTII